jgi:fructose-1,6-bisphosphatase I
MYTRKTLRTHLSNNNVEHELRRMIDNLAGSAKYISLEIRKANRKYKESWNAYNDKQLELDILADKIVLERLSYETSFGVCEFASEERDDFEKIMTNGGRYSVTIDPLDGSSLVDSNLSIGSIIGIHDGSILGNKTARESLVAAIYILYGPQTTLVYSTGKGTHEFILDHSGNWVLLNENLKLNSKGKIYSPGGLRTLWTKPHKNFINRLEDCGYRLRYSGGFVPDINQIIMKKGGLFSHPKFNTGESLLRFVLELTPMAMIIENAGGKATDGVNNILDLKMDELNKKSPIYIGSSYEVDLAKHFLDIGKNEIIDDDEIDDDSVFFN